MTKQDKAKLIKKLYQEGKIKKLGNNAFSVPSELFVKGITSKMVNETLNKEI